MQIFTIDKRGQIQAGALVEEVALSAGVKISAVCVGEQGRGRARGLLPVEGAAPGQRMSAGSLGTTRTGRPKLIAAPATDTTDALLVCRVEPGYRGGLIYSGRFLGYQCRESLWSTPVLATPVCYQRHLTRPETCPGCGRREFQPQYAPPPGEVVITGYVAQGDAGRMGGGEQRIIRIAAGAVLRIRRTGRLYGDPNILLYRYTLGGLKVATPQSADLVFGEEEDWRLWSSL